MINHSSSHFLNSKLTAETEENEVILTETEAAEYIRMSRSFLSKDRMNGYRHGIKEGPEFIKSGKRSIRYRKKDLDAWIIKNRVVRTKSY